MLEIIVECFVSQMIRSGIPGVNERAVQYVQNALLPGQTDAQATATFTRYDNGQIHFHNQLIL